MTYPEHYTPGPASGAHIQKDGDKWTLILVRELRHSPEKVWEALTDPAQLREWAPFVVDGNLGTVGATVKLTWVGNPTPQETTVARADAPDVVPAVNQHDVTFTYTIANHGIAVCLPGVAALVHAGAPPADTTVTGDELCLKKNDVHVVTLKATLASGAYTVVAEWTDSSKAAHPYTGNAPVTHPFSVP